MILHMYFMLWTISGVLFAVSGMPAVDDQMMNTDGELLDSVEARFQILKMKQAALHLENNLLIQQLRQTITSLTEQLHQLQDEQTALEENNADLRNRLNRLQDEQTALMVNNGNLMNRLYQLQEFAGKSVGFLTHPSTNLTYNTGDVLQFGDVFTNIGNAFNSRTNVFTVPVTGTYVFHITIMSADNNRTDESLFYVMLFVDGIKVAAIFSGVDSTHHTQGNGQAVLKLNKSQTVRVQNAYDDSKYFVDSSFFSGALVHADVVQGQKLM